jgi:hypothetical protein
MKALPEISCCIAGMIRESARATMSPASGAALPRGERLGGMSSVSSRRRN